MRTTLARLGSHDFPVLHAGGKERVLGCPALERGSTASSFLPSLASETCERKVRHARPTRRLLTLVSEVEEMSATVGVENAIYALHD
jgi:hypothetical protein